MLFGIGLFLILKNLYMKLNFTYTIFCLAFMAVLFSSNSGGRAGAANAGNTGAPGDADPTCVTCHGSSAAIQVTLSIDLLDGSGNSIDTIGYVGGETYDALVTINVESGSPAGFGFQMLGLNASNGEDGPVASEWSEPADNVQVINVSSTGRTYAEHKGISTSNEFRVKWTAPAANAGDVTFYACGNGVNDNGSTGGDNAACGTFTISEKLNTNTTRPIESLDLVIAPNPVQDVLHIRTISPNSGDYNLTITDLLGRTIYQEVFDLPQGKSDYPLPVSHLETGIYSLHLSGNGKMLTRQIVKR